MAMSAFITHADLARYLMPASRVSCRSRSVLTS